jgi:hypothetical protein
MHAVHRYVAMHPVTLPDHCHAHTLIRLSAKQSKFESLFDIQPKMCAVIRQGADSLWQEPSVILMHF